MRKLAAGSAADTIFALATGMGRSAIAVIRVSGSQCGVVLSMLCGDLPQPRMARLRRLRGADGATLDKAVVLWLPGPNSYTGEDTAELHIHGGRAVLEGVTSALVQAGARPADPGEFTRRAVMNGKLDLLEAEAVGDLIDADSTSQRNAALLQLSGEQSRLLESWTAALRELLALQEGLIDFSDDEVPVETEHTMKAGMTRLIGEIAAAASNTHSGERLRQGLVFVLAGSPNSGKSSLLNALAGRDAAIVSRAPGTTRDAVQVHMDMAGVPVMLVDTAGLRETMDPVEAEGVRRARSYMAEADLVIMLTEESGQVPHISTSVPIVTVRSKTDVAPAPLGWLGVNVVEPGGLDGLKAYLHATVLRLTPQATQPAFSRARHAAALQDAEAHLDAAIEAAQTDIRAEELRLSLGALGRLIGITEAEDVLDRIFANFCVGK